MTSVMRNVFFGLTASAFLAVAADSLAADAGGPPVLAKTLAPARGGAKLTVRSGAFSPGESIPDRYTQNGENMSPAIEWTKGPQGTRSYVVLAEDSGVNRPEPIAHWVMFDINPALTRLPQAMPSEPASNAGMQGKNVAGQTGYIGPKPPAGQEHQYHFQVFALNTRLNLDPATADRNAVIGAMKGKVLASGDLIGNYTGK
jgi:Raf kinase inhibitor-like YbhB/YbcL family protein